MSMVLVIATLFTTFSQTVQASPVKMNTISNGIEMVEKILPKHQYMQNII